MKVLALSTSSNDTDKLIQSIACLGHEVTIHRYDQFPNNLIDAVKAAAPDFTLYISALPGGYAPYVPGVRLLSRINDIAPMVHICSDASDPPWHNALQVYHEQHCFALQVSIDGDMDCPVARWGIVALTPIDPRNFHPKPWEERRLFCGFAGNTWGTHRQGLLTPLQQHDLVTVRARDLGGDSYAAFTDFLADCKLQMSISTTGSGAKRHVKGRVIEAGWSGCCVLDQRTPALATWFTPERDFLEYEGPQDAADKINWAKANQNFCREAAESLRTKIATYHTPTVFWGNVFERIGMKIAA